jgi:hypothetical protein
MHWLRKCYLLSLHNNAIFLINKKHAILLTDDEAGWQTYYALFEEKEEL